MLGISTRMLPGLEHFKIRKANSSEQGLSGDLIEVIDVHVNSKESI